MKLLQEGQIRATGWVVVDHRGVAMLKSMSLKRGDAIAYIAPGAKAWKKFYDLGWRCRRFSLTAA